MKKIVMFSLFLSLLFSTPCFAIGVDWNSNTISAIGVGSAPDYAIKPGQADALARRAAVVDAYRNLASIVYGVEIENHTTVEQLAVKKDTIKTSVAGVIKNARIVDEEQLDDSNYQVTLTMPLFGQNSLASAVWGNEQQTAPSATTIPARTTTTTTSTTSTILLNDDTLMPVPVPPQGVTVPKDGITGLVIDCRGLGLERAMAPNIIDTTGRVIYDSKNVDNKAIVKNGLASYTRSDSPEDIAYAGKNPLIFKAKFLEEFNRNPVISKEDGDKILEKNQESNFLRNCLVVFIQ